MELLSAVYNATAVLQKPASWKWLHNVRPTLKNNLPEIRVQKEKGLANLIMINGLYRRGFMISPAVLDSTLHCESN